MLNCCADQSDCTQNNLMELHALYEYCCPGLLGDRTHFKRQFANKIADSQACLQSMHAFIV